MNQILNPNIQKPYPKWTNEGVQVSLDNGQSVVQTPGTILKQSTHPPLGSSEGVLAAMGSSEGAMPPPLRQTTMTKDMFITTTTTTTTPTAHTVQEHVHHHNHHHNHAHHAHRPNASPPPLRPPPSPSPSLSNFSSSPTLLPILDYLVVIRPPFAYSTILPPHRASSSVFRGQEAVREGQGGLHPSRVGRQYPGHTNEACAPAWTTMTRATSLDNHPKPTSKKTPHLRCQAQPAFAARFSTPVDREKNPGP
ncbi:hypothetical protein SMACR_08413 [Sordaria macrospora]|uniref:Uncharacterized protein n=1 Tax=Sordaria macrospora TaxID=5147 RepID=A0A8S8ZJC1_SORMA|nr:hypothetical protein SMACR_08413 [Sordaria macrospora]WPJ62566.1 hypothetical protein SMAC4_08413 [Sordaria macrospora]